jgi:hypothetical protein
MLLGSGSWAAYPGLRVLLEAILECLLGWIGAEQRRHLPAGIRVA